MAQYHNIVGAVSKIPDQPPQNSLGWLDVEGGFLGLLPEVIFLTASISEGPILAKRTLLGAPWIKDSDHSLASS